MGIRIANTFSFMIKGFTRGAKYFVAGEWGAIFFDVCRACNWGGKIGVRDVKFCGKEFMYFYRYCVVGQFLEGRFWGFYIYIFGKAILFLFQMIVFRVLGLVGCLVRFGIGSKAM